MTLTLFEAIDRAAARAFAAGNVTADNKESDVPAGLVTRAMLSDQIPPEDMQDFVDSCVGLAVSLHDMVHEEDATCARQVSAITVGLAQTFLLGRIWPEGEEQPVTEEIPAVPPPATERPAHGGYPGEASPAWDPYYNVRKEGSE